jgi:hypothetical protein
MKQEWPHLGREGVMSCSKLDRLFACPGHRHLDLPSSEPGEAAIKGTVLHWLLLENETDELPDGMPEDAVDLYLWCKSIFDKQPHKQLGNELYYETDLLTGTADHVRHEDDSLERLYIRDLKTGRISVSAESKQLLGYSYLMWLRYDKKPKYFDCGIIQPLAYGSNVPSVVYTVEDLIQFEKELIEKLGSTGFGYSNACTYCPAKGTAKCEQTNQILSVFKKVS